MPGAGPGTGIDVQKWPALSVVDEGRGTGRHDGDDTRGRPVIAISILKQLGLISSESFADLSPMLIKNRRGQTVGRVESDLRLGPQYLPF